MKRSLLLVLACCARVALAAPPDAGAGFEVIAADFGLFDASSRDLVLDPSDTVPLRVGQRYGWIIELRTAKRSLSVREEYLRPDTAQTKSDDPLVAGLAEATQRRAQVSQRQLVPRNGVIYGEWEIGPGEPAGRRRMQVIVEGRVAADFEYEVVPVKPAERR